jgi:hypothetical protein
MCFVHNCLKGLRKHFDLQHEETLRCNELRNRPWETAMTFFLLSARLSKAWA